MLKSLGRSILRLFARPAPTSVALMVGPVPDLAANDDQSQMLRRAMRAASAAEASGVEATVEAVCLAEPCVTAAVAAVDEIEDSLEGADGVASAANDVEEASEPAEMLCDDDVIARDETIDDEPLMSPAPEATEAERVSPTPADDTGEILEPSREEVDEVVAEEIALADVAPAATQAVDLAAEVPVEMEPRKKRAPAKRKAAKPRKAKATDQAAAAPVEPVPEDDVWVSDAVAWSLSGEWTDGEWSPPESADCPRRLEELREAAAEGRLTIWGRSSDAGVWQPIDAAYWKSGTVEAASLTQGRENVVAEPKAAKAKGKAKAAQKFSALKVSRAQVEELWRPDAMH